MEKYIINDVEYTLDQISSAANDNGVDIDTYINDMGAQVVTDAVEQPTGKPKAVVEGTVPAAADTDLQSENGSLDFQKYNLEEIDSLKLNFNKGKFTQQTQQAYEEYKATGSLNEDLLPQKYSRPVNPETGKEFTAVEWMKNSISNIDIMDEKSSDFWNGEGNLDLASASIARKLFGKEALEKAVAVDATDGSTFWTRITKRN
jgi:hypothetical protein